MKFDQITRINNANGIYMDLEFTSKNELLEIAAVHVVNSSINQSLRLFDFRKVLSSNDANDIKRIFRLSGLTYSQIMTAEETPFIKNWDTFWQKVNRWDDPIFGWNIVTNDLRTIRQMPSIKGLNRTFHLVNLDQEIANELDLHYVMSLSKAAELFKVKNKQPHEALSDAKTTLSVCKKFLGYRDLLKNFHQIEKNQMQHYLRNDFKMKTTKSAYAEQIRSLVFAN